VPLRRVTQRLLFPNLRDACDTHTARIRCLPLMGPAAREPSGDGSGPRSPSPGRRVIWTRFDWRQRGSAQYRGGSRPFRFVRACQL